MSIFEQLQIEEALLRGKTDNFCLINYGSTPSIVMGISGDPNSLIDRNTFNLNPIPVIRRFSGGGTVVVDQNTFFVTFIMNKKSLPIAPYPEPLLKWSEEFYQSAWKIPGFSLRENDYVIYNQKCGGNAQYIQKDRWVHHTSFLWNFSKDKMDYLTVPPKQPLYRQQRSHTEFLCSLNTYFQSPRIMVEPLKQELVKRFCVQEYPFPVHSFKTERQTTKEIFFS